MRGTSDLLLDFKHAHHRLHVHMAQVIEEGVGVPAAQVAALVHLAAIDGATVRDLGEALGLNSAGITGLTSRLEADALLERRANREDGRSVRLHLTPKGKKIVALAKPLLAGIESALVAVFSAKELGVVRRFIAHVDAVGRGAT